MGNETDEPAVTTPPTKLIHLTYEGNFQLECEANLLQFRFIEEEKGEDEVKQNDEVKVELQLDITTMHPQGGGQPSDLGTISTPSHSFNIQHVKLDRPTGIVTHQGTITSSSSSFDEIPVGTNVHVSVDPNQRQILSECHTAGHVVDAAMDRCGYQLPASKGYHFLDGPYVEYKGKLPAEKTKDEILSGLKEAFQEVVSEDIPTEIETYSKQEADELCNRLAQNFDFSDYGEQVRIVTVGGWPCPCGGTHVKSTGGLKERGWGVVGLRAKKGVVRVKYGFQAK